MLNKLNAIATLIANEIEGVSVSIRDLTEVVVSIDYFGELEVTVHEWVRITNGRAYRSNRYDVVGVTYDRTHGIDSEELIAENLERPQLLATIRKAVRAYHYEIA
jgi:hypothetical protein